MTTPLPPHAISTDHPANPRLQWTREELAWIAARDKQFLTYATQARADLEAENQRLREALVAMQRHVEELCTVYGVPLPQATFDKARAALEGKP